jgi:predicted lipoprotein with Yx(FWY)xxD motif
MESYRSPMPRIVPLVASLGCAAVLAACGEDSTEPMGEPRAGDPQEMGEPQPTATARRPRGPTLKLGHSQVGRVLFDGDDRALYTFTRDPSGRSRCHGECAEAWPPFFAKGRPRAAAGVKRSLLGTIARGRRRQVTYRGQPLYFYEHDPRGEVLCNDIVEFGGTWFAVTAEGRPPA